MRAFIHSFLLSWGWMVLAKWPMSVTWLKVISDVYLSSSGSQHVVHGATAAAAWRGSLLEIHSRQTCESELLEMEAKKFMVQQALQVIFCTLKTAKPGPKAWWYHNLKHLFGFYTSCVAVCKTTYLLLRADPQIELITSPFLFTTLLPIHASVIESALFWRIY